MARLSRRRDERGTSIVEFAFVLPLIISMLLGMFTSGLAYSRKISMLDAVRDGARYGASLPVSSDPQGLLSWETAVRSRVAEISAGELATNQVCVKLVYPVGGNDCGVADPPGAASESSVHIVKVSASKSARIEFLFFSTSPTLSAKVAARYERDTG